MMLLDHLCHRITPFLFFLRFFFDVDYFLKVTIEFVTISLLFYVLVFWPHGIWDLSSQFRGRTLTPWIGRRSLKPLDHEGSPSTFLILMFSYDLFYLLKYITFKHGNTLFFFLCFYAYKVLYLVIRYNFTSIFFCSCMASHFTFMLVVTLLPSQQHDTGVCSKTFCFLVLRIALSRDTYYFYIFSVL